MMDVPRYFDHLRANGDRSNLHPFSYNQDDKVFSIADKRVALIKFDPYKFNPIKLGIDNEGIEVDEMTEHPLLFPSFGAIIGGPKLHDWAKNNPMLVAATHKVMRDAFVSFYGDTSFIPEEQSTSHMGFASGIRDNGGLGLQVFGNCSCLGPDPHSMFIDGQFEKGFASYDLHNADSKSQRASLYAGLGHLAQLAANNGEPSQPRQQQLFLP